MSLTNMLRNINGEYELGRVLLAGSGVLAVLSPIGFEAWDMARGGHFDVVAWCTAYPGGLAAMSGIGLFAIGNKEKSVAAARSVQST